MTNKVTLSEAGEAVGSLSAEMDRLYRESFGVSEQQRALVEKFRREMAELSTQQRAIASRLLLLEKAIQCTLESL